MTQHFWQQTQNYIVYNKEIRRKCCNKISYIALGKMAKSSIFDEIFDDICVFDEGKMTFLAKKPFGAYRFRDVRIYPFI